LIPGRGDEGDHGGAVARKRREEGGGRSAKEVSGELG